MGVDFAGTTLFWRAAYALDVHAMRLLTRYGIDGFTALHHAAARGDNETITYLIGRGANVLAVNRAGQTTVDMANSPEQPTQPFPDAIALLERLGAKNHHNCRACK